MNKYQIDKYQDFKENFFALKAALIYLKNAQEAHRKIRKEAIESTTKKLFPGYDEERFAALCKKRKAKWEATMPLSTKKAASTVDE